MKSKNLPREIDAELPSIPPRQELFVPYMYRQDAACAMNRIDVFLFPVHEDNLGLLSEEVHHFPRLDTLRDRYLLLDAVPLEVQRRLLAEFRPRHSVQDLVKGSIQPRKRLRGGVHESGGRRRGGGDGAFSFDSARLCCSAIDHGFISKREIGHAYCTIFVPYMKGEGDCFRPIER